MKAAELFRVSYRIPVALASTLGIHYAGVRLPQLMGKKHVSDAIGFWGKTLGKIMGVEIEELNEPPSREEMGELIISNHMGFLDVPVLLTYFPSVFIIKMEMRKVPFFGKALEHQGHVFVERNDAKSRRQAGKGMMKVLKKGDRLIVFPEGRASSGAERRPFKPFSFVAANRLKKKVQGCVIDYRPDRSVLKWDVDRGMLPQLVELFGRKKTRISVEFLPPEYIEGDPAEAAERYHDVIQGKLEEYDLKKQESVAL